jgi:hypothetical protein
MMDCRVEQPVVRRFEESRMFSEGRRMPLASPDLRLPIADRSDKIPPMSLRTTTDRSGPPGPFLAALTASALLAAPGCVERLLQIRSDPPGAEVTVNGVRIGTTPIDHPFDFYGTFDVTLRAKDRISVRRLETVRAPWYEVPPIDFVAENLVPFRIRDHREVPVTLEPAAQGEEVDAERREVIGRMEALESKIEPPRETEGKEEGQRP